MTSQSSGRTNADPLALLPRSQPHSNAPNSGITLGVSTLLIYLLFLWLACAWLMRRHGVPARKRADFYRSMTHLIVSVLLLARSPLAIC